MKIYPRGSISVIVLSIGVLFFADCKKSPAKDDQDNNAPGPPFVRGADVSWVTEMENDGVKFYNSSGVETECMGLLKDLGVNAVRLRAWVDPSATGGWCSTADVVSKAVRASSLGMKVMIDLHYSDWWADPGKQYKPAAWELLDVDSLKTAVFNYTRDVMTALKARGITPEWVQVGNEVNDGFLWPHGKASTNMSNFAELVSAGYDGVKSVSPASKVIVHVSNGFDNHLFRWLFDGLKNAGGKWDIIGMSLYPTSADWSAQNEQCLANMNDMITRYQSDIMICETGMSWDEPATCQAFLKDLIRKVSSLPANKGLGVFYWEPECFVNWNGYTLGAFDNSARPTTALDAFQ